MNTTLEHQTLSWRCTQNKPHLSEPIPSKDYSDSRVQKPKKMMAESYALKGFQP
jgi:hypothetical protein